MNTANPTKIYKPGKAITNERLNIRSSPDTKSVITNIAGENIPLAFDGYTNEGEAISGNSKWYFTNEGHWFWSGGILEDLIPDKFWWLKNEYFATTALWKYTKGDNVRVAVIDSGIGNNDNINMRNIDGYNFLNDNNNYLDFSNGHGTHISGIVTAVGKKVFGLAPNAKLFIAKVINEADEVDSKALIKALRKCIDLKVDIVNMSIAITPADFQKDSYLQENLPGLINALKQNQIYAVASCGNYEIPLDCYPAKFEECISVTAVDENLNRYNQACTSGTINISAPGVEIFSTIFNNINVNLSGTSQAAAYVSGFLALMKSFMSTQNGWSYEELLNQLLNKQNLTNNSLAYDQFGNGIINPAKIFSEIKSRDIL